MSREDIISELYQWNVTIHELKYSAQHVSVYRGAQASTTVAVKVLPWQVGTEYKGLEQECATMRALPHPNILTLLNAFWLNKADRTYFVIVTEWCEKDLEKDIRQRADNHFPFTEAELLQLVRQTIDALAFMQTQGIAHRDIKPQNIFLTTTKSIKIGDFGSASMGDFGALVGTPYYLSPILKQALVNKQSAILHDPFKSDMYSLGLTFLAAAMLGTSQVFMRPIGDDIMLQEIANIGYSEEVKMLLRGMLSYDESNRWNFEDIKKWMDTRPWGSPHTYPNPRPYPDPVPQEYIPVPQEYKPVPQEYIPVPQEYKPVPQEYIPVPAYKPPVVVPTAEKKPVHTPFPSPIVAHPVTSFPPSHYPNSELAQPLLPRPPSLPSTTDTPVLCMGCSKPVNRIPRSTAVQLCCRPDYDMYCSKFCFITAFRAHQPFVCPQCHMEVDPSALADFRAIQELFSTCLFCDRPINAKTEQEKATFPRASCMLLEHIYCSNECFQRLKGSCPVCRGERSTHTESGESKVGKWLCLLIIGLLLVLFLLIGYMFMPAAVEE